MEGNSRTQSGWHSQERAPAGMVHGPADGLEAEAMAKNRVMVLYLDENGAPRAWACGPSDKVAQIRKRAADQLQTYLSRHADARQADFTESVQNIRGGRGND